MGPPPTNILLVSGDGCCPPALHALPQNLGLGSGSLGLAKCNLGNNPAAKVKYNNDCLGT